jgi:hypothetical protein
MNMLHESVRNLRALLAKVGEEYPYDGDEQAIQTWRKSFDAIAGDLQRIETALRCAQSAFSAGLAGTR